MPVAAWPVELVYYDDQSNPSNVPGIYTKLITVDKVDLLLGPYATNMAAAAVPVIMQHNMTTISILAVDVNRHFHYSRYFDMIPVRKGRGRCRRPSSRSPRRRKQSHNPLRSSPPTPNFRKPPLTARGRTPMPRASRSSMTKTIRRLRPISHR